MRIGIDASRAFLHRRTGIEEYSYQVIKHLRDVLPADAEVVLYVRKNFQFSIFNFQTRTNVSNSTFNIQHSTFFPKISVKLQTPAPDFPLPANWSVKGLWAPRFWTQVRLSLEMLSAPPTVLFVPAHTVPLIHPQQTIVTVHGLEYEFSPESYAWYERFYMRWSVRYSTTVAKCVIAVSENTKRDLIRLYAIPKEKIKVVYEGIGDKNQESRIKNQEKDSPFSILHSPFFLFIGRLETRKNIVRIIEAFEYFKQKTGLPHQLVLAGKPGYGYSAIKKQLSKSRYRDYIREVGYVNEERKWSLLKNADVALFPSLYEGFGLPVIEAQSVGVPVIISDTASLPEIAGEGAVLVDPLKSQMIAEAMVMLVTDHEKRADILRKASQNSQRFSWEKCADDLTNILSSVL